jgi:hypothetical protein
MRELIDKLIGTESYYYIDYIPHNPLSPEYLELEAYYEQTYLHIFADKISRILLQIIWAYPCRVCLGEATKEIAKYVDIQPFTDIRNHAPEYLATLIKTVIEQEFSFLSILLDETQTLVTVGGAFQVVLYQPSEELLGLTKQLCQAEGLFLKHRLPDGSRVLVSCCA